jgi:hypothetical protein
MSRCYYCLLVVTLVALMTPQQANGDLNAVETGESARAHWNFLMAGWRGEREKLRSYRVTVNGNELDYRSHTVDGTLDGLLSNDKITLRLLRNESGYLRTEIGRRQRSGSGTWIATDEYIASHGIHSGSLVMISKVGDEMQEFAIKMQPATLGILGWNDFSYHRTVDQIESAYDFFTTKLTPYQIKSISAGKYEVLLGNSLRIEDGTVVYDMHALVINESRGFSVESRSSYIAEKPDAPAKVPKSRIRVDWSQRDNNWWVPTSFEEVGITGNSRVDLKLSWISVGAPISDEEFALDSLGAPKGTAIYDARLGNGEAIFIGHIGETLNLKPIQSTIQPVRNSTAFLMIAASGAFFVAVVGILVTWKRLRTRYQ